MGVLGLTPFIQKYCPEVIREFPHRLKSLSGKTIAIDGTLISQRLHFAPMPCDNRHILGWYRLIRELKEADVGVICVFDGETRGIAKQRENERRKKVQKIEAGRGSMEAERLSRLRRLAELLKRYQALPETQKDRSQVFLRNSLRRPPDRHGSRGNMSVHKSGFDIPRLSMQHSVPEPTDIVGKHMAEDRESPPVITATTSGNERTKNHPLALKLLGEIPTDVSKTRPSNDNVDSPRDPFSPFFPVESLYDATVSCDEEISRAQDPVTQSSVESMSPVETHFDQVPRASPTDLISSPPSDVQIPLEQYLEAEDELSSEFSELFKYPNVSADTFGLISAQTYVLEPPNGLLQDFEHNSTSLPFEDFEIDGIAIDGSEAAGEPGNIGKELLSLYEDYHQSIPAVMSTPTVGSPSVMSLEEADAGAKEQYAMSKNQVQLTLDEGNLWHSIVDPSASGEPDVQGMLEVLEKRSEVLSRSYDIRNNIPTARIYQESKYILRAMGVPCIETPVPYEAEALAASLVHHGFADYVASEDTDVLVYEAPLLRNITNRQSPLTLLSGAEFRQVLQLDRASYVDFALLLGTDFSQRIKNLGPHRAIKLIRTHKSIEVVIANEPKFIPHLPQDVYLEQVGVARLLFETLPPLPDPKLLQPTESDERLIAAILEKYGVYRAAMVDWDFKSSLGGNYFGDDPSTT